MNKIRLENRPEDFSRRKINPNKIELWEDGKRDDDRAGAYEWWYFDGMFQNGMKFVCTFNTKGLFNIKKSGTKPLVMIDITLPDGTKFEKQTEYGLDVSSYSKEKCDVKIGPHHVSGDLKTYHICIKPDKDMDGIGLDLTLESQSSPWRPGTGYYDFGPDKKGNPTYFTWLPVVPKGKVHGTVSYQGKTVEVSGSGYHDHQWGNIEQTLAFNSWLWGRQNFGDYTMLVFDLITSKDYGYQRLPMMFLQDKDGHVLFDNFKTETVSCKVLEEYQQEGSGKNYPKKTRYIFTDGTKRLEYALDVKQEIERKNFYAEAPFPAKLIFNIKGMRPSYAREVAVGTVKFEDGENVIERSGEMIYEFPFLSTSYREHMEK